MKIGIGIEASFIDRQGYGRWGEDTYNKLKEFGYSCVDFNMADTESIIYTAPKEESDAMLLHEKELALRAGIEINQAHGPWRCPVQDFTEADRIERMDKMKKSIRATAILGCKNWVIHPLMPYGTEEINTENAQKTWDINLTFMSELLKTAKEYDITICLENMPMHKFSLAKPSDILRFVQTINNEHFKICLDTGHVAVFDDLVLADETRRLGKEIRALHVHDNRNNLDLHLMPYLGVIDWESFAIALKDIQFDGCFSLETAPSKKLSDVLFEDTSRLLLKISQEITSCI